MEIGTYEKLNEALLKWFTSMRANNIPVNGPIIEKDVNVSDKNNLYILFLFSLYNTLNREEKTPAYFFQNLAEII